MPMLSWLTRRSRLAQLTLFVLVFLAGSSLLLLEWSHRQWRATLQVQVTALDNLSEARRHVTLAYLITGRVAMGDPTFDLQDVQAHLERANLVLGDWQRGESTLLRMRGAPPPTPALVALVREYQAEVAAFQELFPPRASVAADPVTQRTAFASLERQAGFLEGELYAALGRDLMQQEQGHVATLLTWGVVLVLVGITLAQVVVARERAAVQLQQSQARLDGILQSAMDAIIAVDMQQRIVLVNSAAERLFGYPDGTLLYQPLDQVLPEHFRDQQQLFKAAVGISTAIRTGEDHLQPLVAQRANGTSVPVEASIARVAGSDETLFTIILRDISERLAAQAALQASEARFAKLFHASPVATAITRITDGQIVDVNDHYLVVTGHHRSRVVGARTSDLNMWVSPTDRARLMTVLEQEGRVRNFETRTRRANGEVIDVLVATDIINLDGERLLLTTFVDITARKQAEAALRDQARLLDLVSEAIIVHQGAGGGITFWNAGAEGLYGWRREEALGQPTHALRQTRFPVSRAATEAELTATGYWEGELIHTTKDGREIVVHSRWVAPGADEPLAGRVLEVNRDLTEHKHLQAQLLQSQKMESIGQLAGGVAHDFNNLLTAITGYAALLEAEVPDDPHVLSDLQEIQKAAQRATTLTRQLLTFARRQPLAAVGVDLNRLLREMDGLLRRVLGEHIALHMVLPVDAWTAWGDAGQIEQVVVNLAVNARDAMPEGGTLTIETANVVLDTAYTRLHIDIAAGPYVMLVVTDTGVGMTPAVQTRIFEPFFTTKAPGVGTGLGLSTCYGIIKQHGGSIEVASEVGSGTTFRVYFPRAPVAVGEPLVVPTHGTAVLIGTETVLLVEDEDTVRALAARVLRDLGYTVLEAHDGQDALDVAGAYAGRIDLLLTDVVMPRVGGPEVAAHLSKTRPEVAVLFMSGYDGHATRYRELLAAHTIVHKPFTPIRLAQAVRQVLDHPEHHNLQ